VDGPVTKAQLAVHFFTLGCPFRNSKEKKWGIPLRANSQPEKVEWPNEKNTNEVRELAYSDFACVLFLHSLERMDDASELRGVS